MLLIVTDGMSVEEKASNNGTSVGLGVGVYVGLGVGGLGVLVHCMFCSTTVDQCEGSFEKSGSKHTIVPSLPVVRCHFTRHFSRFAEDTVIGKVWVNEREFPRINCLEAHMEMIVS